MGFLNPNNWFAGSDDPTGYTNSTGQSVAPGQLAPEAIGGQYGQNSLDQYLRSLTNYGGTAGQSTLQAGQNLINSGAGNAGTAANYWSSVLTNPMSALTPSITALRSGYNTAKNNVSNFAPMGGGRANLLQQLPFQEGGQIANLISQGQQAAGTNLGNLGLGMGQLGINQSNVGGNLLSMTLSSLMNRRGQNVDETGQNKSLAGQMSTAAAMPFKFG